jgi:hypothetical protein
MIGRDDSNAGPAATEELEAPMTRGLTKITLPASVIPYYDNRVWTFTTPPASTGQR